MKTIMITGGCGFMGSHFVKYWLSAHPDDRIVIVDKLTYAGNLKNLEGLIDDERCIFKEYDIADLVIETIMAYYHVQWVVNFAAETHVDRSIRHPKSFVETDILGIVNLVLCSMRAKVERFLHISTDEVYGPILEGEADESSPLNPTSPYSASKAAADLLLLAYHKTYGFPVIIARPCNNFGPNQYPEKLIPMAITRMLKGKEVMVHGIGDEVREWIPVQYCVRILAKILEGYLDNDFIRGFYGKIVNIGSGYREWNIRMVHDIGRAMGVCPSLKLVSNRPGNDRRYAINSNLLKVKPYDSKTIMERLKETVQWYHDNPDWWGEVDLDSNVYREGEYLR